ncbi:MAG: endonuclease NucS [Rhodospirillaceae bacterium]|nr:endonuclease NucS [Rhodospirillaceae bacterium]
MAKLAAWAIDRQQGEDALRPPAPKRLASSRIELEKHLEDWIANDVALIGEGLTLVGRQVKIDDGILDLLAIDTQDRWVVIEIKSGVLTSGALTQALYYAASIARLDGGDLKEKLEPGLGRFGEAAQLSERLDRQLAAEEEGREIAVLLVGAGIHPGLERMNEFLGRFAVPIGVVSFEVFELDGGPQLLIREVVDEPSRPSSPPRRFSVEAVRDRAGAAGVAERFDRFVNIAKAAGLIVKPNKLSVSIVPPANRARMLMYTYPSAGGGGQLYFEVSPATFSEFFPHLNESETVDALSALNKVYAGGDELDAVLDRIEEFLAERVQRPDGPGT